MNGSGVLDWQKYAIHILSDPILERGKLNSFRTRVAFGLIQLLGENSWMDARRNIPRTQQRSIFLTKRVTCGCGRRKELLELRRLPWRTDRNPVALHCYFFFIQRPALMRWEWTSARAGGRNRAKAKEQSARAAFVFSLHALSFIAHVSAPVHFARALFSLYFHAYALSHTLEARNLFSQHRLNAFRQEGVIAWVADLQWYEKKFANICVKRKWKKCVLENLVKMVSKILTKSSIHFTNF